jgi:predicted membrane protein
MRRHDCQTHISFHNHHQPNGLKKLIIGVIIASIGALLLADNIGVLPYQIKDIFFSWQMLLIAIGAINLAGRNSFFAGVILITIGAFFLIPNLIHFSFEFTRLLWPVIFIVIGLVIIFRRKPKYTNCFNNNTTESCNPINSTDDFIDILAILGGTKRFIQSQNFKGGKITTIFGGAELDFSQSKLAEGSNEIEITTIFGGSSMVVPADWNVRIEVASILGGFADKRKLNTSENPENKNKELVIKGVAIFGGGEIKNY